MMTSNFIARLGTVLFVITSSACIIACKEPPVELPKDQPMEKPIPFDPEQVETIYLAAQQEFIAGNFDKAEELYRTILFRERTARAWHALGDVHMASMNFTGAVDDFKRALELEPTKRMSQIRLGQALQRAGRFLEAVDAFQKAQAQKPDDPEAYRLEGNALTPLGRQDEAIERYEKSLTLEANKAKRAETLMTMGELATKKEDFSRAAGFWERAASETPSVETFAALAETQVKAGNFEGAKAAYRAAAEREKSDPFYWEAVGEIELRQGNKQWAKEAFEASLKTAERSSIHLALGRMALLDGDNAEAENRLNKAMDTSEGAFQEIVDTAQLAAQMKKFPLAADLLKTLDGAEDAKDQAMLWRQIAFLRREAGDSDGVVVACSRAQKAFVDTLTESQKRLVTSMKSLAEEKPGDADNIPDTVTVEDAAAANRLCTEAMMELQKLGAQKPETMTADFADAQSELSEKVSQACTRSQRYQEILMKGADEATIRKLTEKQAAQHSVEIPKIPVCPPLTANWPKE